MHMGIKLIIFRDKGEMNLKVGVVLPIYNQERDYVFECFLAIEQQTYCNFELVVVLDGANIDTVKATYEAAAHLTSPDKVVVIHRKENKGIAYSLNEGFKLLPHCTHLTWISSDNRQLPHFLETLVKEMLASPPNTVLTYSMFYPINENGERYISDHLWFPALYHTMRRAKEEIMVLSFIGASFLFTREAYEQAGGYDPAFGIVSDYEFWIRLLQHGEIHFVREALMEYRYQGMYSLTTITPREELYLQSMKASLFHKRRRGNIPRVTVIITAHNHAKYIDNCIRSVLAQTYTNFHLVVFDVGSDDTTLAEILKVRDTRIMPIHINKRAKVEVLNQGLEYALGEYVIELDGDDWFEPSTLEVMVREMDAQPSDVAMAYANRRIWFEKNGQLEEGPVLPGLVYKDKFEVLTKFQTHCPRIYRLSALKELNGWETSINGEPLLADDYMMFLKIVDRYKTHWINSTLYHQRRHQTNITILDKEELNRQYRSVVYEILQRWESPLRPEFEEVEGTITGIKLL